MRILTYTSGSRTTCSGFTRRLFLERLTGFLIILGLLLAGCTRQDEDPEESSELIIYTINDPHGQIDNFARIAHIVELERSINNVFLVCGGDIFSGNPVVDNHPEKGYPMIDLMNRVGFDVAVVGNHEYDYGPEILTERMEQAEFEWICANVDMGDTGIPEPDDYVTLSIGDLKVTFLGLVETNGKQDATIPSTHPWRVKGITFQRPETVVAQYAKLKEQEDSDLLVALTHLGHDGYGGSMGDNQLAGFYPFFDLIIGGHSHKTFENLVNDIPIYQAGSYLNYLGKITIVVRNKQISAVHFKIIHLDSHRDSDPDIQQVIDEYNDLPYLNEVIGRSFAAHPKEKVGCFYTDALRQVLGTDLTFQNTGGIRSTLDAGDITRREIFEIDPFNNGTVIYEMTAGEIISFLKGTGSGFYYSGIEIEQLGNDIILTDSTGSIIEQERILTVGINDYIPAVHESYFPSEGEIQPMTSAESIIYYLENINDQVNYILCERYFRYD